MTPPKTSANPNITILQRAKVGVQLPPCCVDELEKYADTVNDEVTADYIRGGGGACVTRDRNVEAFKKWSLLPDYLARDVSKPNLTRSILSGEHTLPMPIGISPSAFHKWSHEDGELATARAAESTGVPMILSCLSNHLLEDVRAAAPKAKLWLNLYLWKDLKTNEAMIRRAEAAGFSAIVISIDIGVLSTRRGLPIGAKLAAFPVAHFNKEEMVDHGDGDPAETWESFGRVVKMTTLPVIAKGVLTARSARQALSHGAAAILVSNHGGRQLDGVPASIDCLPSVVRAVGDRIDVYMDSGVRSGTDIYRALALGARAVFTGRPVLWALAYQGVAGVELLIEILRRELTTTMQLSGCAELSHITRSMIIHEKDLVARL